MEDGLVARGNVVAIILDTSGNPSIVIVVLVEHILLLRSITELFVHLWLAGLTEAAFVKLGSVNDVEYLRLNPLTMRVEGLLPLVHLVQSLLYMRVNHLNI